MATYFHGGSEIQDNQQTLYVMNPNYSYITAYSDAHNPNNMLLLNALSQGSFPHAPPHQPPSQPFIAIPLSDNRAQAWAQARAQEPSTRQGLSLTLSPQQQRNPMAPPGLILGSKYLKAAQELLDEVASVAANNKGTKVGPSEKEKGTRVASGMVDDQQSLNHAQRQELQMKKTKLLNMLDEVEQRYKEYQIQMQAVVSSLEQAVGPRSTKSYTSLALKTISRQFRFLKDGIASQINATNKSLGLVEDGDKHGDKPIGSRLSLVNRELRQQRALHHLGIVSPHTNAWRPQRGLPERAVSVLRAWLFDHFLHPYPKDSDKHMLAKQTGLTRSQVSNWFINARVRLWKPMVEEMYSEEMKAQERHGDNTTVTATATPTVTVIATNTELSPTKGPKKQRSHNGSSPSNILSMDRMETKLQAQAQLHGEKSEAGQPGDGLGFNQAYIVHDINPDHLAGPYGSNGVSLTLGLRNLEEQVFLPNPSNNQLGRRLEVGADFWAHNNGYDTIDIHSRKRFANQLLHDFVA